MKHRSKGPQKGPVSTPSGGPVFVSPEDQKRMSLDRSLYIKQRLGVTDEETVLQIQENHYIQFFLGFAGYSSKAPFDPSMIVHFRRRFSDKDLRRSN
jgi:hypothetical protein